jgi:hypothetical protein
VLLLCVEVLKIVDLRFLCTTIESKANKWDSGTSNRDESFTFPHSNSVVFARKYPESSVCPHILWVQEPFFFVAVAGIWRILLLVHSTLPEHPINVSLLLTVTTTESGTEREYVLKSLT